MNQTPGAFPVMRGAVAVAICCVAAQAANAQTVPGPNALYIAKAPLGDCGPAVVTLQAGGAAMLPPLPPPPGIVGGPPLQVRQLVHPPAEAPKSGAPYSAVGTTETVQTLADGNRIVHTNASHYYRDSSGRTRTELSLSAVGPFTLEESSTVVMITDPVAKQRFVLHPEQKRADVLPLGPVALATGAGGAKHTADAAGGVVSTGSPARCLPGGGSVPATSVSLGQKTLAGLQATGTKTEYTIAAGQIGNEQPITVTSEKWVSEELGVTVSSTLHDPMIGDTQFHLSQIERTEPDPSLFAVPADYTLNDVTAGKPVIIQR
jgi:hypothetical protein